MKRIILFIIVILIVSCSTSERKSEIPEKYNKYPVYMKVALTDEYVINSEGIQLIAYWLDKTKKIASQSVDKQVNFLVEKGIVMKNDTVVKYPKRFLTKGSLAKMILKGLNINGGLFNSLIGGSKYAYREAVHYHIFPKGGSAFQKITGRELVAVINRASKYNKEDELLNEDKIKWDKELNTGSSPETVDAIRKNK